MNLLTIYGTAPVSLSASASVPRLLAQLLENISANAPDIKFFVACPPGGVLPDTHHIPVTFGLRDRIIRKLTNLPEGVLWSEKAARTARYWGVKPDVVIATRSHSASAARKIFPRSKIIYWIHDLPAESKRQWTEGGLKAADVVIVASKALADALRSTYDAPAITIIPNGVDLDQFKPATTASEKLSLRQMFGIPDHTLAIVHAGGDAINKGRQVVEAALVSADIQQPVVLVSAGSGNPLRKQLAPNIHLSQTGQLPPAHLSGLFKAADIGVFPSRTFENQPMVLIEMMASGLPVVASDVGGVGEIVKNGQSAILIRNPTNRREWEGALWKLADDANLRARLSAAALIRSQYFSKNNVAIQNAWRSLLGI